MKKTISRIDASAHLMRLFVALFFIILWLPIVQMNLPLLSEATSYEKRKLAEKPGIWKMIVPSLYVEAYDRYFNDRYGFRVSLIRLNSLFHLKVFHTSTRPDAIIGKHGWLIYNSPTDGVSLKDYCGNANFSESELKQIKSRIIFIHEELKKRKIHFLIVVAPNKHTIYPEYLPFNIRQPQGKKTRLDQVAQALNNSDVDFIDLRFCLQDKKKHTDYPLYYRTDTHWNDLGAFFAYEEILTHLRRTYPGIKQLGLDDFIVRSENNRGTGDMAYFLNLQGLMSDTRIQLMPKMKFTAVPVPMTGMGQIIFQVPNLDLPVLVMFRDSFTTPLIPYLSESFSKSIYIGGQKINFPVIEREKPAIVICELVERYLGNLGGL